MFFVVDDFPKKPMQCRGGGGGALCFVSIGNCNFAEQFHHTVLSIKLVMDHTGFHFENLSLTELRL